MKKLAIIYSIFMIFYTSLLSQTILVDEEYDDWSSISPIYSDTQNDQLSGITDFQDLWITNNDNYLFLRLEVDGKINLQNDNLISLYIDTDHLATTGLRISGIGAELEYHFGERYGIVRLGGNSYSINHLNISLVSAPTVTSTQFEIAIGLNSKVNGLPLFNTENLKLLIIDNGEGRDQIPNVNETISYTLKNDTESSIPAFSINKPDPDYLRVLSYNVLRDNLFDSQLYDNYSRLLKAIDPDIIGFQEIYQHNSEGTANIVESILPSNNNETWYHSKAPDLIPTNQYNTDLIFVSRFTIKESFRIEGYFIDGVVEDRANFAVLLDLRPKYDSDLLVLNAHPPCCARNNYRQEEVDKMMAFFREAKNEGGELTLQPNTPIIILGDMNFVGYDNQRETLLTGNISDNVNYGEDFLPDWDGSNLADSKPFTTGLPMVYTWYDEGESFSPGRLDYIIYSSSVLEMKNAYSLFTPALNSDSLSRNNLESNDAVLASDHLPVVADFELKNITSIGKSEDPKIIHEIKLHQNYPNPFNPTTTIEYTIPSNDLGELSNVNLVVYNILGSKIATLVNENRPPGIYQVIFDVKDLPSGTYFYQLKTNHSIITKKMILIQ